MLTADYVKITNEAGKSDVLGVDIDKQERTWKSICETQNNKST